MDHRNLTPCIGHVVRKLAAKVNAALLVIAEREARPPSGARLFDRILVAVGNDAASATAVRAAVDLAVKVGSEVLAVHVWSHDLPRLGPSAAECGLREDDPSLEHALH